MHVLEFIPFSSLMQHQCTELVIKITITIHNINVAFPSWTSKNSARDLKSHSILQHIALFFSSYYCKVRIEHYTKYVISSPFTPGSLPQAATRLTTKSVQRVVVVNMQTWKCSGEWWHVAHKWCTVRGGCKDAASKSLKQTILNGLMDA